MLLRNVGIYRRVYMAPKPRRTTSSSSPPWKSHISHLNEVFEICIIYSVHDCVTSIQARGCSELCIPSARNCGSTRLLGLQIIILHRPHTSGIKLIISKICKLMWQSGTETSQRYRWAELGPPTKRAKVGRLFQDLLCPLKRRQKEIFVIIQLKICYHIVCF
jgi:hypothetical protein